MRWKTVRWRAAPASLGMNWTAEAPVPMTATRLPVRSIEWSHWAEWKAGPVKDARPGMSGNFGMWRAPMAETTACGRSVSPSSVVTVQVRVASSYARVVTRRP
ncbi:hypothetical protein GCM10020001_062640 [Nonomuraea salmonea]